MTLTRARTVQYIGILFSLMLIAVGYWYFSVRAGVKTNTSVSQSQGTGQLDSGLTGYWKLDENTGTSAADSSTNGNTGTLTNGPTWTTGQIGSAVTFDGTNDYIDLGNTSTNDVDAPFTQSVWIYPTAVPSSIGNILLQGQDAFGTETYIYTSNSFGNLTIKVGINGSGTGIQTGYLPINTWYHIVMTYDSTTLSFYLDGVLYSSANYAGSITERDNNMRIGADKDGTGNFTGKIDEVRVYDRLLLADEVGQIYRLTTPTATDTYLNGYWSFNAQDMSGTTAYDRSGARNTGTLTNGPTKASGIIGQALNFDGTDDYVTVPDNSALDVPSNFVTLSGWFNRDTATTDDVILAKRNGVAAANAGYIVYLDATTDKLIFEMSDGTDEYSMTSTTAFTAPGWHHFAITYEDDVSSTTQIYIDGLVNQATKSGTISAIDDITNAVAFVVGAESDAGSPFDGKIDEIRMYQGIVLPAARIKTLFDQAQPDEMNTSAVQAAGVGRLESGLTAYFALDDGTSGASPTSASDSSTNSLAAGTLTNGPVWAAGQIGSSVDFDGTDDYIAVADTPLLDFGDTDDFTLTGWFNRESYTTDDVLVAKRTTLLAGANGYVAYIDDATDQIIFEVSDGTDEYSLTSTSTFSAASKVDWHHFAIVWDQDSPAQSEIYIDGIADNATDSGTIGNIGDLSNAVQFGIGVNSLAGDDYDGKIDEVRVYSRALAPDEIVQLYRLATPTGIDTGLEGYWSFDSEATPGTIAFDRSGARNTGTLTSGPTAVIGRVGQALNVVAATSYVTIPDSASLSPTAAMTFSFWLRPTGTISGSEKILLNKSAVNQRTFYISSTSAGAVKLYLASTIGDSGSNYGVSPDGVLVLNQWTHVTTVFDGAGTGNAGRAKIYINGSEQPVTYTGTIAATIPDSTSSLNIGNNLTATYDEVRFYSRALTAAEIKAQYDASAPDKGNSSSSQPQGTGNLDSGLAGYWKLDETTGSNAADASTNGNTGTLTNMENGDWVAGQIGNGLDFDGVDEYVSTGLPVVSKGSVSAWVNGTFSLSNSRDWRIFSAATTGSHLQFGASGWGGYDSWYLFYRGSSGAYVTVIAPTQTDVQIQGWHHVVATWDTAKGATIYVDGVSVVTSTTTTGSFGSMNYYLSSSEASQGWQGKMDETRAYDRILSADEVSQLYRLGTPTGTDTSLKGYWSFNGTDMSGTTAYDRSGARNDGTLTGGPTKTIGKLGQALSFDNVDDYISVPDSAVFTQSALTVSFWKKNTNVASNSKYVTKSATNQRSWSVESSDAGRNIKFIVSSSSASESEYGETPNGSMAAGEWYHVVAVFNGAGSGNAGRMQIYINGVAQSITFTGTIPASLVDAAQAVTLGGKADAVGFLGALDEVRIYNRAFTVAEVQGLYNQSK